MSVFLDTNILVYSYDRLSGERHQAAVDLLVDLVKANEIVVVSTQIVNEFIVVMTRKAKYPLSLEITRNHVKKFSQVFNILPVQIEDCFRAISIATRYQLSYWDSLVSLSGSKPLAFRRRL